MAEPSSWLSAISREQGSLAARRTAALHSPADYRREPPRIRLGVRMNRRVESLRAEEPVPSCLRGR